MATQHGLECIPRAHALRIDQRIHRARHGSRSSMVGWWKLRQHLGEIHASAQSTQGDRVIVQRVLDPSHPARASTAVTGDHYSPPCWWHGPPPTTIRLHAIRVVMDSVALIVTN